ncbi:hypothetical protein, partial [Mesorhizobium sanjuanii]|uniref:hypothetical protein n=1 Tax=Mesorhizobium sanjuanii TaxID=2037900 RepID=UPI001AD7E55E
FLLSMVDSDDEDFSEIRRSSLSSRSDVFFQHPKTHREKATSPCSLKPRPAEALGTQPNDGNGTIISKFRQNLCHAESPAFAT